MKINLNSILLFIVGFILLRPPYATPMLVPFISLLLIVAFLVSLDSVSRFFSSSSKQSKSVYITMVVMTLFIYISRFLNGWNFTSAVLKDFIYQITLINVFSYYIRKEFWIKLTILDFILSSYVIINFICMIIYPNGMFITELSNENWFLGFKNIMVRTFIPAIIISCVVSWHKKRHLSLRNYIIYLICFISVVLGKTTTGIVVHLILGAFLLYLGFFNKIKYFGVFYIFIATFALTILIVFFSLQENFSYFIEKYLNKDATFTGRIYIWEAAVAEYLKSPIIGYGYHISNEWRELLDYMDIFKKVKMPSHPHNFVLYILLQGGLVYFLFFSYLFFLITKFVSSLKNYVIVNFLTLMYLAFFIDGITESLTGALMFFPMLGVYMIIYDSIERKVRMSQKLTEKHTLLP